MANKMQSRPDSGLGFQVKIVYPFIPSSLGRSAGLYVLLDVRVGEFVVQGGAKQRERAREREREGIHRGCGRGLWRTARPHQVGGGVTYPTRVNVFPCKGA